ncbi:MAG TPA: hypothetical protein DEB25_07695 [Desulfobulbaceae bacterium]|nr:hypothetical protein [Desulfobulbaceae bacterium]
MQSGIHVVLQLTGTKGRFFTISLLSQLDMQIFTRTLPALFIALLLLSFHPASALAAVLERVTKNIEDGQDAFSLLFEGRSKPKIFSIGGDSPRLVFDFPGARYPGPQKIAADGAVVKAVRIATHQNPLKTRVVFDLIPGRAIDYKQEFLEDSQTLRISFSNKGEKPAASSPAPVQETAPPAVPAKATETASPFAGPLLAAKSSSKTTRPTVPEDASSSPAAARLFAYSLVTQPTGGDVLRLQLDSYASPKITAHEGEKPQIVCFFPRMRLAVPKELNRPLSGKFIQKVAVSEQKKPAGIQIVINLEGGHDYDIRQVFVKDESIFELIVNVFNY